MEQRFSPYNIIIDRQLIRAGIAIPTGAPLKLFSLYAENAFLRIIINKAAANHKQN